MRLFKSQLVGAGPVLKKMVVFNPRRLLMSGVKSSAGGKKGIKKPKKRKVLIRPREAVKNMDTHPSVQVISKKINVQKLIEDN
jgi:hypothetical protein